ncbi:MAG: porin family protein [Alphaproteobacteria bacterium]|nr:porin family protein [Alphaproteobacteria bacterium]
MRVFTLIFTLVASVLAAASVPAQAQTSRLYFAGYMGLNTHKPSDFINKPSGLKGTIDKDNALSFAGAMGVRLDEKWRLEAELSLRKADLSSQSISGVGSFPVGGELKTWLFMLNGYYDFDWRWRNIQPYVSAGLGFARQDGEIEDLSGFTTDTSDDSIGFAWQAGAGAKYRVRPDMAFTGGYRYIGTSDIQWDNYEMKYHSHEFRIGLEYDIPVRRR